ncbi:hypothetical protein [Streptomyces sp. OE57]|uniref:hypothetical protein n=1 Tax=Streptomyces lacaronensis TaxID=3379885 RepID=UPI0039B76DF8
MLVGVVENRPGGTGHVGIRQHLPGFVEAEQRLVEAPYPTWTIIGVSGLASPGLLVEIRATAAYPDASR